MKRALRIVLIVLAVPVVLVLGLLGFGFLDAYVTGNPAASYTAESEALGGLAGYSIFYPPQAADPSPAVVLIHEWWGLTGEHVEKAERLAAEGYVVIAPDLFGGNQAATVPGALALNLTYDGEAIFAAMDSAYDILATDPRVDASRIAVAGFCFGGRQAMHFGIRDPRPAATVTFYGSGLVTDPADQGSLGAGGPVLGIWGEVDASIPLDEVAAFNAAMDARGVTYESTIYPGMGHAFVKADELDQPGAPRDAWEEFLGFLAENL